MESLYQQSPDEFSSDDEFAEILDENFSEEEVHDFDKVSRNVMINIQHNTEELMLMTLKNANENELGLTGITSLANMVNVICGTNVLPQTKYALEKYCKAETKYTLHAACPDCFKYLGKFEDLKDDGVADCSICNVQVDCFNASSSCYFAMIDPSDSIREKKMRTTMTVY